MVESNATQLANTDDLISEFFQLVEKPVIDSESEPISISVGYFEETLSWLTTVETSDQTDSLSLFYNMQDMAIAQQFLCGCLEHSSQLEAPTSGSPYSDSYASLYSQDNLNSLGLDSHTGHEHCNCGGHYKDGKCESCGSLKHDD